MMFPNREAVGLEWPAPLPGAPGQRVKPKIIGVIRDVRYGGLDKPGPPTIFACWEKLAPSNAQLLVRTAGNPEAVAASLRRVVHEMDPSLPLFPVQTLDEVVAGSMC